MIVTPRNATPRCTAVVDLLSKVFRPYNFLVTVTGEPPHKCVRRYKISAPDDNSAAILGMHLFVKEFTPKAIAEGMGHSAPKAKLI